MGLLSLPRIGRRAPSKKTHFSLPPALFPTGDYTASVNAWANSVHDIAENGDCRIRRIIHCKANSDLRQEFVLICIRHPSGKEAIVLAGRDTSLELSASETDTDKLPSFVRESIADMKALGVLSGHDCVRLSVDGSEASLRQHMPAGWAEIHTIKYPKRSEAPSVAHLAVLLTVLHHHVLSPSAPVEIRSGWFAYCVTEVMREVFGGKVKPNKSWVRIPYGGMKVEERRDTVDGLIQEFKPAWENFSRRKRGGQSTEHKSKRRSRRQERRKSQMDALLHMMRTMWDPVYDYL